MTPTPKPTPTPGKDTTRPKLSSLGLKKGKLSLSLTERSTVTFTVQVRKRRTTSRKTYWATYRTSKKTLPRGKSSLSLPISKKAPRGSYRLLVGARDKAGNRSKTATLSFSVAK